MSQTNKPVPQLVPEAASFGTTNSKRVITICKNPNIGALPVFLNFAHRQLEKGNPSPLGIREGLSVYSLPVDIFRLVLPEDRLDLIDDVEGFYVLYEERL